MAWFSYKNPEFHSEGAHIDGLNVGFSSEEDQHVVLRHIHTLCESIGIKHRDLALANQIHSNNVLVVERGGVYPNVDAFVSKTPGVALGIQVADCGALLLGDFENKVIAAVHAGWRGTVGEIVPHTISKMQELGADKQNITAFISPCLGAHNFEVGEEVASKFPGHLVNDDEYEKPHVNMVGLLKEQLLDAGVLSANIEADGRCTIDEESLFYSYRREKEKSGRMLAIIKLNKL
ncbi:MAG: peptidoglycan editing factor PgeF [Balneolaceae bacterium]|nr:peptidoglycan editing factor PgeF [Balneolaceae bacterium]